MLSSLLISSRNELLHLSSSISSFLRLLALTNDNVLFFCANKEELNLQSRKRRWKSHSSLISLGLWLALQNLYSSVKADGLGNYWKNRTVRLNSRFLSEMGRLFESNGGRIRCWLCWVSFFYFVRTFLQQNFPSKSPTFRLVKLLAETFLWGWNRGVKWFDESKQVIHQLSTNYLLWIISNTHYPNLVYRNLSKASLDSAFDVIVTFVELGIKKLDCRIFEHAASRLGAKTGDCIYVGIIQKRITKEPLALEWRWCSQIEMANIRISPGIASTDWRNWSHGWL